MKIVETKLQGMANLRQVQVTEYVDTARAVHLPLSPGQLEAMVALHFDIPLSRAKRMTSAARKKLLALELETEGTK